MDNEIQLNIKVSTKSDNFALIYEILQGDNVFLNKSILKMLGLKYKKFYLLDRKNQKNEVKIAVDKLYQKKLRKMQDSILKFKQIWKDNGQKVQQEFINIFKSFPKQKCFALSTFNNRIFPRYLDAKAFNFYFKFNESNFLQNAIHEITHFIWFDKLKTLMPNLKQTDFESPSPVWLFSEIAVDMVFESSDFFKQISCKTGSTPAYDYFYKDKIGDITIINYFRELFKKCKNMNEFIVLGTNECIKIFKNGKWIN